MKDSKIAEQNSNNIAATIGLLVIGAALGGAIAVLTTPQKGKDLRNKISGKTNDFTDSLRSKFNSLLNEAKAEYETEIQKVKKEAKATREDSKEFAGKVKN